MEFNKDVLQIDPGYEVERIVQLMRNSISSDFLRKGAVVGVSGGVDSATVLALAVNALGSENVTALTLPEKDSNAQSETLAEQLATQFNVKLIKKDLTDVLTSLGCYKYRDAAVQSVYPNFDPNCDGIKLVLPSDLLEHGSLNVFSLALVKSGKEVKRKILPVTAYLEIVAASNMKQRTRMLTLYYYAEKQNYAVIGTANKNEYDQGFFVKYGDGGSDIQPIQHLYKTQVYQLAHYLQIPQEIIDRTPTTDTYSAECTQEEFYFRLPFELMDLIWYGYENQLSPQIVSQKLNLQPNQIEYVYRDLAQKALTTDYLRLQSVNLSSRKKNAQNGF